MRINTDVPLFSIIISYRNREIDRVRRCLDALATQNNGFFEVIFIDYGSDEYFSEESASLVRRYKFAYYYYNATKGWFWNRSHALNSGLAYAKGEIVLMYDIDLIVEVDFIEKISKLHYNSAFYLFECFYLSQNFDFSSKNVLTEGMHYRQGYVGLCAVKKIDIIAINGFDEYFMVWGAEDEDLYKRLENNGLEMKRLTASEYRMFHQWHATESPSFPTLWYLTMIDRLFNKNRLIRKVEQVWGSIINQRNRKIFSLMADDCFDVELKLLMGHKFLVFHDLTRDFLNPAYRSGKFHFIKTSSTSTSRRKAIFGLSKKNVPNEYISAREITHFIQYLVGVNRPILADYFFSSNDEDEVNFYYLKNASKPTIANG